MFQKGNKAAVGSGRKLIDRVDKVLLERLAFANLTDKQMAIALGISERSINRMRDKPEFEAVIKSGKQSKGAHVEASAYQAALGYTYFERTWENKGKNGGGKLTLTKKVEKQIAPNALAFIFLLTNWMGDQYKHRGAMESGELPAIVINNLPRDLEGLTALRERIDKVRERKRLGEGVDLGEVRARAVEEQQASEKLGKAISQDRLGEAEDTAKG